MQPLLQVNVKRTNPDPRIGVTTGTMATPVSLLNFDFVSDKPQNEIFTFSGAVEALTWVITEYIEW